MALAEILRIADPAANAGSPALPQNVEAEAALLRARGQEVAQSLRAVADRQAVEIIAAAQRDAEILRGEGDAQRSLIFANAYNLLTMTGVKFVDPEHPDSDNGRLYPLNKTYTIGISATF